MRSTALVVVVLLCCIMVIACSQRESKTHDMVRLLRSSLARFFNSVPEIPADLECLPHNGNDPIVIPLKADSNGIFTMQLFVGNCAHDTAARHTSRDANGRRCWTPHIVAVDTGSEALVLSGDRCASAQLPGSKACSLPAVKTQEKAPTDELVYGSQHDRVEWQTKKVLLRSWRMTCDTSDDDAALTTSDDSSYTPHCVVGEVKAAIVHRRTGTSNYSILGLGNGGTGVHSFLAKLFPNARRRSFSIHVHSRQKARLILYNDGRITCNEPRHRIPISKTRSHHHLVRMKSLELLKGNTPPHKLDIKRTPDLLLDTGANALSAPSAIFDLLQSKQTGQLRITLEDDEGEDFTLQFNFDINNRRNNQVIDSGGSKKLIVGVSSLVNYAVGVEYRDSGERYVTLDYF